jgi:hypothetical protein
VGEWSFVPVRSEPSLDPRAIRHIPETLNDLTTLQTIQPGRRAPPPTPLPTARATPLLLYIDGKALTPLKPRGAAHIVAAAPPEKTPPVSTQSPPPSECFLGWICIGVCVIIVAALACFAIMVVGAAADTKASLSFSQQSCSWRAKWWSDLNPFGCLEPSFAKTSIKASDAIASSRTQRCRGPTVEQLFGEHRGDDDFIDVDEASALATAVDGLLTRYSKRSCAPLTKRSACFVHATSSEWMDHAQTELFLHCHVASLAPECRVRVCSDP